MDNQELIERTWAEVGCRLRPLKRTVMVRTLPIPQKVGSLWLPAKAASFYGGMPHQILIRAIVLSAGPQSHVAPGEKVCFQRLWFSRWKGLSDGCYVGYLDAVKLAGIVEDDTEEQAAANAA
jgi:hypothetical protein